MRIITDYDYHPPSEEHPAPQEFALPGDEYNATASDPPRRRRKGLRHSMLTPYAAGLTAAALISSGLIGAASAAPTPRPEPVAVAETPADSVPEPPPAETQPDIVPTTVSATEPKTEPPTTEAAPVILTLAEAIAQYPDWYDADRDVRLHFDDEEGWFADSSFFHRFAWQTVNDTDGMTIMAFNDVGAGYTPSGSMDNAAEYPMTLSFTDGEYLLEATSGMGEGGISTYDGYTASELTVNRFAPAEEAAADADIAAMRAVLGRTTTELLTSVGHFTVAERADMSAEAGPPASPADSMSTLSFDSDGSGTLTFSSGIAAPIRWNVDGDYATTIDIAYDGVTFSNGVMYMSDNTGELTLTADGPRLWFYNFPDSTETCFAPAEE